MPSGSSTADTPFSDTILGMSFTTHGPEQKLLRECRWSAYGVRSIMPRNFQDGADRVVADVCFFARADDNSGSVSLDQASAYDG
jgi:hypothetical protein